MWSEVQYQITRGFAIVPFTKYQMLLMLEVFTVHKEAVMEYKSFVISIEFQSTLSGSHGASVSS